MLGWALNRRGEVYLKHATLAAEDGNTGESQRLDRLAIADFELAVKADPGKWKAVHNRGTYYAVQGRLQEALRDFDRVVSLNPDYANAWFNRAELRFDLGQYETAIRDYSEALLRDETLHVALRKRGQSKFKLGKVRSALTDFESGLEADDSDAQLYVDRGECHRVMGNWERAAADFRRAIELQPNLSQAYQRVAWLMATCPESRFRDNAMAIRAARQALELGDADDYQSRDVLAAALASDGQYELAVEELQRAIGVAPRDARPLLDQRLELYQNNRPYRQRVEAVAGKK
jgi:tetratricopeptide (TPR) repeat protein